MLLRPRVRFSKARYIIAKYCIYIIIYLLWKVEHLSKIYGLSTEYKLMAQPTAQKLATTNCRKIDDGNPNNSANIYLSTDIYAYSKTTFGGPTIGCVMTENWIYGCCRFWEDVTVSHFGHTRNGHKKTVPRIRFVNHIKTLFKWVPIM